MSVINFYTTIQLTYFKTRKLYVVIVFDVSIPPIKCYHVAIFKTYCHVSIKNTKIIMNQFKYTQKKMDVWD